jgi:hypothetical protein
MDGVSLDRRKVVNRAVLMAVHPVERAGENMAAWMKAIWSAMVCIDSRDGVGNKSGWQQVVRRCEWLAMRPGLSEEKQ